MACRSFDGNGLFYIIIVLFWQGQNTDTRGDHRQTDRQVETQNETETMTATSKSNGFAWPNNARLAIAVTCLLENWSGDKGPPFSVQTTALKPGTHDRAAMSGAPTG